MATRILVGAALERLAELPDASVHCVMTSPPYWRLRDYGNATWVGGDSGCDHRKDTEHQKQGSTSMRKGRANVEEQRNENFTDACPCGAVRAGGGIGLEGTLAEHIARLVEVFREVRRVLRPDGTVWVNYGDAHAGSWGAQGHRETPASLSRNQIANHPKFASHAGTIRDAGYKPKDLLGLPWRLAFALPGRRLVAPPRQRVGEAEPHARERDRPPDLVARIRLPAHPKRRDDLLDAPRPRRLPHAARAGLPMGSQGHREEVAAEPPGWRESNEWRRINLWSGHDYFYDPVAVRQPGSPNTHARRKDGEKRPAKGSDPNDNRPGTWRDLRTVEEQAAIGSNLRDVWWIPTAQFREAHFATFPERLAEIPIRSGTSAAGCCPDCGAPWTRLVRPAKPTELEGQYAKPYEGTTGKNFEGSRAENARDVKSRIVAAAREGRLTLATTGWTPSCRHEGKAVPCTVLDPFAGAGTVGLVAGRLNRDSILVEISPKYADMARRRILGATGLLNPVGVS